MKKILIVDDDEAILESLQMVLEDEGYQTQTLADGKQTLENIKIFSPDLVLLDVLLSGSDGREICRQIKSDHSLKNTPVVMITAHPNPRAVLQTSGADDLISKPFDVDSMLSTLKKFLV
jgi:DNA-binding response OmpR family regulator